MNSELQFIAMYGVVLVVVLLGVWKLPVRPLGKFLLGAVAAIGVSFGAAWIYLDALGSAFKN